MQFEDEVIEILTRWLKADKIMFYFVPLQLDYHCAVYFERHNIYYRCEIPYTPDMDAHKVAHTLLQDITHNIMCYFYKED